MVVIYGCDVIGVISMVGGISTGDEWNIYIRWVEYDHQEILISMDIYLIHKYVFNPWILPIHRCNATGRIPWVGH